MERQEIIEKLEKMEYIGSDDGEDIIFWEDRLSKYFPKESILYKTDYDREDCLHESFLISLNEDFINLDDEELDELIKSKDAYFLDISISTEKPLSTMVFYKYPKGLAGQLLELSEEGFLKEHKEFKDLYLSFAETEGLLHLDSFILEENTLLEGEEVSIYYKYFDRDDEYKSID